MTKVAPKTTTMNVRLDVATRRELQNYADNLGIPATRLVVANIKQFLKSDEVRLTRPLEPTPYLVKIMERVEADLKAGGKNITQTNSFEEVRAHLNSL